MAETIKLFSTMFHLLPGHIARLPSQASLAVKFGRVTEFKPMKYEKRWVPLPQLIHKLSLALLHASYWLE